MSTPKSSNRFVPWAGGLLIACVAAVGLIAAAGWWPPSVIPTDTHLEDQIKALEITVQETDVQLSKLSGRERDDIQRLSAALVSVEGQLASLLSTPGHGDSRQITRILIQLKAIDKDLTTLFNRTSKPERLR